jgi:hypothetical protein
MHLTGYFVHPLMLLLLLLTLPVGILEPSAFKIAALSALAGFGSPLLYLVATSPQTPALHERFKLIPLMLLTGFGISLSTSIAVLQGLTGKGSVVFQRTPKLNLSSNVHQEQKAFDKSYIQPIEPIVWAEIALGFYALITIIFLYPYIGWGIAPWMIIYMLGYFYIAGLNLIQHMPKGNRKTTRSFAG